MAEVVNFLIDQGSTFTYDYIYMVNEVVVDITNYDARGKIKSKATDTTAKATFTCTIPDGTNGTIHIVLPAADSSAVALRGTSYLDTTDFYYDIELYNISDEVIRVLNGKVTMSPEITK